MPLMADVTEELIYEYWDCDKCGNKAIRGDLRSCSKCGSPRNEAIQFYRMEGKEEVITEAIEKEKFTAGADWLCSFCNTLNAIQNDSCVSCGASKLDSEKNYFDVQKAKEEKLNKQRPKAEISESKFNWKKFSLWALGILGSCTIGIYFLTKTHDVEFEVKEVSWERIIKVNRYTRDLKSDWSNELRGDSIQEVSSSKEIRSYEDRQVGTKTEYYNDTEEYQSGSKRECSTTYESTGSGASKKKTSCENVPTYSTRTVRKSRTVPVYQKFPVYDRKIKYYSNSYVFFREFNLTGNDNSPKDPEVELGAGVEGKPDTKDPTIEVYKVVLQKVKPEDKAIEIQKLSTTFSLFTTSYLKGSRILKPVDIFDKISPAKNEILLEEK
jgi:ribosomal protein L37E